MEGHPAARAVRPQAAADPERTLVATRVFDAPREDVFRAWIDAAQLAKWMGPRSIVRADATKLDARPGGGYRIVMHADSGNTYTVGGIYREVVPPERLVFTWAWEGGGDSRPGGETLVTVTFRAIGRKTEMTLRHEFFETKETRDQHNSGWDGSFDKLSELLSGAKGRA